jgi:hypothetical protein
MSGKDSGFICWTHPVDKNKKDKRNEKYLVMERSLTEIIPGSNIMAGA